jgi:hypothetical protein
MRVAILKHMPKRRCRIPRRPHPDLDFFFGRYERADLEPNDVTGPEDLEPSAPVATTQFSRTAA